MFKNIYYGMLHVLISFTSVVFVVASIPNANLPLAFLATGVSTILFQFVTKGKLPALTGVSAAYIGGITAVGTQYGIGAVGAGVVGAGVVYLIISLMLQFKPQLLTKIPTYLLNLSVFVVALSLLPIGASLASSNVLVSFIVLLVAGTMLWSKKGASFAIPVALIIGTIVQALTTGLTPNATETALVFTPLILNWKAVSLISLVALSTTFESLSDMQNLSNACETTLDQVGAHRVLRANGLSTLLSGLVGGLALTTYSENVNMIYATKHKNSASQIVAGLIYIGMAFIPTLPLLASYLPQSGLGAILILLFGLSAMNSLKRLKLDTQASQITTYIVLITFFWASQALPSVSAIALSLVAGIVYHLILTFKTNRRNKNGVFV